MNAFLSPLECRKVGYGTDGKAHFRLLTDLVYESERFGLRVVPAGFITNFASVPRLPVVFLIAGGRAEEEATLHDYEYTIRELPREDCDALFYEALRADKPYEYREKQTTPGWLAWIMWAGVRLGGAAGYRAETTVPQPEIVRLEIEAP